MERKELEYKIERFEKFILQNRFTIEEFYEMEGYLKEIQPSWSGCASCPAQVQFGKTLLKGRLEGLKNELNSFEEVMLESKINEPEMEIPYETPIEAKLEIPPVPKGKIQVTSTCKRCQKKNKTGM